MSCYSISQPAPWGPQAPPWSRHLAKRMAKANLMSGGHRHGHRRGSGRTGGPPWARGGFPFGGPGAQGGGPFGPGRFGPGRRAGRGDVREGILALLSEEPMHGYQIMRELAERSGGAWRPSPGSVYPTLQQLEDEGLIASAQSDAGKRVYELTDAGRERVSASGDSPAPWESAAGEVDDELIELRDLAFTVGAAVMQVAHAGGSGQIAQAREILKEARRGLYRLLAEDEDSGKTGSADEPGGQES
jgi:DNA-binding PadR family transcriptional regulator